MTRRREDVPGASVVSFEPDDLRAGEFMLEPQDVIDLRPSPAIDRLIIIPDAADVLAGLPLPACGERVGVRGTDRGLSASRVPLTRRAFAARSRIDLSPQAGRGKGPHWCIKRIAERVLGLILRDGAIARRRRA